MMMAASASKAGGGEPALINFTIQSNRYPSQSWIATAQAGMTWREWVNTDWNLGYLGEGTYPYRVVAEYDGFTDLIVPKYFNTSYYALFLETYGNWVFADDVIIADAVYKYKDEK